MQWPDSARVASRLSALHLNCVKLEDDGKVFIANSNTKIGFGGIGKGYAADMAALKLQSLGVQNGVINASGDLYCWGNDAQNNPWKVAISDPKNRDKALFWLEANQRAVVTSGDYEKYKIYNGTRYAHIINPKTGYPVRGLKSVTIVAPKAELADALATAIFVMGIKEGLAFVNEQKNIECIIIDENDKIWYSKGISKLAN